MTRERAVHVYENALREWMRSELKGETDGGATFAAVTTAEAGK